MRALPTAFMALAPVGLILALAVASPVAARHERVTATKQCIPLQSIRDESADADDRLIFHTKGGSAFRNRLPEPCENLRRINTIDRLKLSAVGDVQLCAGDTVQVVDHHGSILGAFGGDDANARKISCKLGEFEPISEMSLTEELRR